MRALVVSDIHSNLPALEAVFRETRRKRLDLLICLGDVVGYGGQPNQVIERLLKHRAPKLFIRGNHDRVALGEGEGEEFNPTARQAVLWTRARLSPSSRRALRSFQKGPVEKEGISLFHGSALDEDEYLFSEHAARRTFEAIGMRSALFGHTHIPSVFEIEPGGAISATVIRGDAKIVLESESRYLLNPGSVGQPRDRNPSAAYGIFDFAKMTFRIRRVEYDVDAAQRAILAANLPQILADRLGSGF
ncbi:MAG TPA: metallophosphoesterase family protein [Thermoanaerobaculia bacterium]|nr:metallophosphoesterase family protein [Thermoanaerobaculia bacterium]